MSKEYDSVWGHGSFGGFYTGSSRSTFGRRIFFGDHYEKPTSKATQFMRSTAQMFIAVVIGAIIGLAPVYLPKLSETNPQRAQKPSSIERGAGFDSSTIIRDMQGSSFREIPAE